MKCEWYHIFNTLPNQWLTFDQIIEKVKIRYKNINDIEEALNDMVSDGKYIKSKKICNTVKYRWRL